jgi:hypothetical protein
MDDGFALAFFGELDELGEFFCEEDFAELL